MHLEKQVSQFNPADSIRSKNAPEVLFVDEDGNPIEAGRENVIFVDETGIELSEDEAMELINSGRYLDSRDLNQDNNTTTNTQSRSAGAFSQATFNASQASLPASAFGSLSKSTGAGIGQLQQEYQQRSLPQQQQQHQSQYSDSRASFAQSQVKSIIGGDTTNTTNLDSNQQHQQQHSYEPTSAVQSTAYTNKTVTTNNTGNTLKSASNLEVQKSHSGRRIAQPPPKRLDEIFNGSNASVNGNEFQQQVIDLQNLINKEKFQQVFEDKSNAEILRMQQAAAQFQQVPTPKSTVYSYQQAPQQQQQSEFYVHQNFKYSQNTSNEMQTEAPKLARNKSNNSNYAKQSSTRNNYSTNQQRQQQQQQMNGINRATREKLKEYGDNFVIQSVQQVGNLTGKQIIRDLTNADSSIFERYYQQEQRPSNESSDGDVKSNQFIDPFSPDLFKDEIIDIDFGAIDAFTTALNAQLNAEKSGNPAPNNLQFPSHILTSNHAAFIDNQLLLGDSSGSGGDGKASGETSGNGSSGEDVGAGADGGGSGINVQFLSSSKDFNQSNSNLNGNNTENMDGISGIGVGSVGMSMGGGASAGGGAGGSGGGGGYSQSNSFGSIIDIQSQSYATSQATRPTRSLVIDNVPNELAGLINLEDLNSALNRASVDGGGGMNNNNNNNTGGFGSILGSVNGQMSQSKLINALHDVVKSRQQRNSNFNSNNNNNVSKSNNNTTNTNINANQYVYVNK